MTLAYMESVRRVIDAYFKAPACVLVANSVWNRAESVSPVALFDTRELAEAYELAARLPESRYENGRRRTYREGTLLYDCNMGTADGHDFGRSPESMFRRAPPWLDYGELPRNPPAP